MSIMGRVMLECDTKGCHGCEVIEAEDFNNAVTSRSIEVSAFFVGWVMDDHGEIHCPQCCEEGRERADDDGREYGHPGDRLRGIE